MVGRGSGAFFWLEFSSCNAQRGDPWEWRIIGSWPAALALAMGKKNPREETVLVGVLKNRRDRDLLFREHWYRIPLVYAPKRKFRYLAFYQPAAFGRGGSSIRYYARVVDSRARKRRALLPREPKHPRADERYVQFRVGRIRVLPRPIRNVLPRRVSFGYTTLRRLRAARNLLQLYGVVPTEQIVERTLARVGILAVPQQSVSCSDKRYRLDFAVFCRRGAIAIECDNAKAHSGRRQRAKDRAKNAALRRCGWVVLRLAERDILSNLDRSMRRVQRAVKKLGGSAERCALDATKRIAVPFTSSMTAPAVPPGFQLTGRTNDRHPLPRHVSAVRR
ncbi:MAG: hypothetical protein G01um101438_775 [Parcubacteria group bacterium Gr01-1014_38]|nr:MAG: hypothetical protein G01um101438_775 [Parcubacteria group bacterium Gr01-1014_38]